MSLDLIISGGTVATSSDVFSCDIGVRDGRIVALGHDLGTATRTIDATGRLVLPGGIDSHVHIAQPSGEGIVMADDFDSGTLSAAFGGNTTVMPFCVQEKGVSLRETVKAYHAKAEGWCHTDVSFHLVISDPTEQVLGQDLPALIEDGYTSFKVFMTYQDLALSDREMLEVMSVARETGALVMVHAENDDAIRFLTDRLERGGHVAPRFHGTSRPIPVEREATHRAISLAELVDVPIMIVHVSNREAMDEIARARARGLKVYGETCPQYLVLTERDMDGLNMEGAKYVCSPPPARPRQPDRLLGRSGERSLLGLLLRPLPVPLRFTRRQAPRQGSHLVPLGPERDTRRGDALADPVLGGRRERPHHAEPVRRPLGDQPREDLRPDA